MTGYSAVVVLDAPDAVAHQYNRLCRETIPAVPFLKSDICGVFGQVFCDFGDAFTVADVDGENPKTGIIASMDRGEKTLVCFVEDERVEFEEGDWVSFSEVHGMDEIASPRSGPFQVRRRRRRQRRLSGTLTRTLGLL